MWYFETCGQCRIRISQITPINESCDINIRTVICSVLQCVAVCCWVLQCVAVCCSVLQCVAVCCSVLLGAAVCRCVLLCVAVCCIVLQCVDLTWYSETCVQCRIRISQTTPINLSRGIPRHSCSELQSVAGHCCVFCVLQCAAVCCSILLCVSSDGTHLY